MVKATLPDGFIPRHRLAPSRATAPRPRDRSLLLTRMFPVTPMLSTLPTLMVTAVYYGWYVYLREMRRRDRVLRERVTYMLWVAAVGSDDRAA